MVKGIIPFAHQILADNVQPGDTVVDATCGNGNDTLFLSKLVGETGHVYAFDIQEQAINNTKTKMTENQMKNATYIHDNHAHLSTYIPKNLKGNIGGAIFNLGYLPRS